MCQRKRAELSLSPFVVPGSGLFLLAFSFTLALLLFLAFVFLLFLILDFLLELLQLFLGLFLQLLTKLGLFTFLALT